MPEQWQSYGFENRDFDFWDRGGALLENRCLITVELPDYDIASIDTGQYAGAERFWQANFPAPDARAPTARSLFEVRRDGDSLIYAKERCAWYDTAAPFFLHITPADPEVLPEPWRSYGFINRDFSFDPEGVRSDGKCFISRPLPGYDIVRIHTGQYAGNTRIWEMELTPE